MTNDQMRYAISRVYSSDSWQRKVEKMSDAQVFAIYQKFSADGKFDFEPVRKISSIAVNIGKAIKNESSIAIVGNKGYKEEFEQLAMDGFSFPKKRNRKK